MATKRPKLGDNITAAPDTQKAMADLSRLASQSRQAPDIGKIERVSRTAYLPTPYDDMVRMVVAHRQREAIMRGDKGRVTIGNVLDEAFSLWVKAHREEIVASGYTLEEVEALAAHFLGE